MSEPCLTPDADCFHRRLDLCARGSAFLAAWIDWDCGRGEFIRFRSGRADGSLAPVQSVRCTGYSPSQVRGALREDGTAVVVWSGFEDGRGKLFAVQDDAADALTTPAGGNWGDLALIADEAGAVWLAVEAWEDRTVAIRVFRLDGPDWREVSVPRASQFCRRPALAAAGGAVLVAWDRYVVGQYEIASMRIVGDAAKPVEPVRHEGDWCALPAATGGPDGSFFLSYCRERLVELPGEQANHHSRIVAARLARSGGAWETQGSIDIDHAMNPWMAAYAGRRRFSTVVADGEGAARVLVEEKIDPKAMDPGPGRLVMRRAAGESGEHVLLEGQSNYVVASQLLESGLLPVASKTQQHKGQMRIPYLLHLCDPRGPLRGRPELLASNASAPSFRLPDLGVSGRPRMGPYTLYFGDPHLHSAMSGDLDGEQDELYHFARDVAALDFAAFTENDFTWFTEPLSGDGRARNGRNAEHFNRPGEFTALVGWEYTSHSHPDTGAGQDSHRSVLARGGSVPMHTWFAGETPTPADLVRRFRDDESVILHHHHPFGFDLSDDRVERNVEIVSGWGAWMSDSPRFVDAVHALLEAGLRFGFIGGSDNHERNPGLGGALTGAWAGTNTREGIFEALRARRCFATTGIRPELRVTVCGAIMGEQVTTSEPPVVDIVVRSFSARVQRIEIVRDGRVVRQSDHWSLAVAERWEDQSCPPGTHYYYVHVRFEGRQDVLPWNQATACGVYAWTSPAWVQLTAGT